MCGGLAMGAIGWVREQSVCEVLGVKIGRKVYMCGCGSDGVEKLFACWHFTS